jgi:1,4-alpha-glucan branching enzyme
MPQGYLTFVLHAHLPFVRHPEYNSFLEERWLFEAITETYIPVLQVAQRLLRDGVKGTLTISISPSLLAMLEDPLLQRRYREHLGNLLRLAEAEQRRLEHDGHLRWLAGVYHGLFAEALEVFERHEGRLAVPFRDLHRAGAIELCTTSATHGILPLLAAQPGCVEAQLITGLDYFESVFGFRPQGMWLPECAWAPGLDELLRREGVRYVFVESHAVEHASVSPLRGIHAPVYTPAGLGMFARDRGSTKEVWSAQEGFPGDPNYREFYRDVGHDLDFQYIQQYLGGDVRSDTGLKYYRITGPGAFKEPYNPHVAQEQAGEHAAAFLGKRINHVEYLESVMGAPPMIVAPFDAELFGHWWFEGPKWLDYVIRKAAFDQDVLELTTCGRYLDEHPVHQLNLPATSTWGHKGNFETWLNAENDWIYIHLLELGQRMHELACTFKDREPDAVTARALAQCAREVLLAQSSDWPFIITQGTSSDYATRRVRDHVCRFHYLANAVAAGALDQEVLGALEYIDNIFPEVDFRLFAPPETT